MDHNTEREGQVTTTPPARKAICKDCIYLVQTRHHLSQQIIGYHCFSIGRQQARPQHYDFTGAEIQKEHDCPWFQSYEEFAAEHAEDADYSPKIQRYVTIRVKWGYDWQKAESPEEKEAR
ncbi:MAG: hypothetical protein A2Z21_00800 [Candidatus Fraserbacteria bacterium RBG_16_55_9]|uniref:Uncharacterized protein n=1 Tax=Fraserbacteria sp. (strain RBG_16_55_9) TaxID=1817864 RepID=A0A1F5UXR4_FRAXR|nr:MAG: hypothetical protein A2Z21_00800 [Candidatus Fraserbacteria bacterium RBG_16_55_9]